MAEVRDEILATLDRERERQLMTKEQLAGRCGMSGAAVRRLLGGKRMDVRLSTLRKVASALGAEITVETIDRDLDAGEARLLVDRLGRRNVAERLARGSGLDAGDIEHALHNLTLLPEERLRRRFRGRIREARRG